MGRARYDHVPQMIEPPPRTDAVQALSKGAASTDVEPRNVLYSPRSRRFGSGRSSRNRYSSWGYGLYFRLFFSISPFLSSRGLANVSCSGLARSGPCSSTTTLNPALARSQLIVPPPPLLPTMTKSTFSMLCLHPGYGVQTDSFSEHLDSGVCIFPRKPFSLIS